MTINHKNLRSLKNQAQPYPPCDTTAAHRGQTQLALSKALSRKCSLQCWTVFICHCEVAAMKICSYPYKTKEKDFLTSTAVFSTSIPLCLRHSLSAITHPCAQSFPVALPWNNATKKALHGRHTAVTLLWTTAVPRAGHHPLGAVMARIHPSSLSRV